MSFDFAAVDTLMANVTSHAQRLAIFETVHTHEPKSAPGAGMHYCVWVQSIEPIHTSGLSSTSGRVEVTGRIYSSFIQKPEEDIDPNILSAEATLLNEYTSDFNFGGTLRMLDLLGAYGSPLSAKSGYVDIDRKIYRVMTTVIPLIFNDMFTQTP